MIEKPEWYQLCENVELKQHFLDLSRGFTRNPELREDLYQEAWLGIGEYFKDHPGGKTLEFYKKLGFRWMNKYYMKEYRSRNICRPWVHSASYYRVQRKLKKIQESATNEPKSRKECNEE